MIMTLHEPEIVRSRQQMLVWVLVIACHAYTYSIKRSRQMYHDIFTDDPYQDRNNVIEPMQGNHITKRVLAVTIDAYTAEVSAM